MTEMPRTRGGEKWSEEARNMPGDVANTHNDAAEGIENEGTVCSGVTATCP